MAQTYGHVHAYTCTRIYAYVLHLTPLACMNLGLATCWRDTHVPFRYSYETRNACLKQFKLSAGITDFGNNKALLIKMDCNRLTVFTVPSADAKFLHFCTFSFMCVNVASVSDQFTSFYNFLLFTNIVHVSILKTV